MSIEVETTNILGLSESVIALLDPKVIEFLEFYEQLKKKKASEKLKQNNKD